jgi:hypothetical protein
MPEPLLLADAVAMVDSWLARPNVTIAQVTDQHWNVLQNMLHAVGHGAALTMDAHLACLAIEHNAEIATADEDFLIFPGLPGATLSNRKPGAQRLNQQWHSLFKKYGGTSVGNTERIKNVASRVAKYRAQGDQVVVGCLRDEWRHRRIDQARQGNHAAADRAPRWTCFWRRAKQTTIALTAIALHAMKG